MPSPEYGEPMSSDVGGAIAAAYAALDEIHKRHKAPSGSNYCEFCEIRLPCPDRTAAISGLTALWALRWLWDELSPSPEWLAKHDLLP